jgi:hypothetical protein
VGLQDAFNLCWKLAALVSGWGSPGLLETYHTERHAAGARVLLNTRAQVVLAEAGEKIDSIRALFAEMAAFEPVRRHLTESVTGVGTHYHMGSEEPHPLLGRLAPNLFLETSSGPSKVSALLHSGRAVLLDLADRSELRATAGGWSDRVDTIVAECPEGCGADALLIRPDGYTAWVAPTGSRDGQRGLLESLVTWCGDERR